MSIDLNKSIKLISKYDRSNSASLNNKRIAMLALKENKNLDLDEY
jgi:hypothetical protein